jgi:addiction module RelE/StbE family toxin
LNIFFTGAAKADLANISAAIAQTNPARAERVLRALRQGCEGLADMPRRFQLVPRFEHKGVRRRVVEDYLIFYRVDDASVQILHILHGATEYAAQLLQDD